MKIKDSTQIPHKNLIEQEKTFVKAQDLISFGKARGWRFSDMGTAPVPNGPVIVGKWLLVPEQMDESILPISAAQKIQAIRFAGLKPRGYVIAHEIPEEKNEYPKEKSITQKPSEQSAVKSPEIGSNNKNNTSNLLERIGSILKKLPLILPILFIGSLLLLDPILIAITDDYTWIEIERWKEEGG